MALAAVLHLVSLSHTFYRCPDLGRCSAYTKACETAIAKKVSRIRNNTLMRLKISKSFLLRRKVVHFIGILIPHQL
jgi:hypothetical protein